MLSLFEKFDVAIAGAGPAGSSVAIRLSQAGFSVLLVEQKKFPREKLCGEFISPECLTHFEELGVMPTITAACGTELSETVFYSRNGKRFSIDNTWFGDSSSHALGLSRAEMDSCLLQRARQSGVVVLEQTSAAGLIVDEDRVIGLNLKRNHEYSESVLARISIDATGRSGALARHVDPRPQHATRAHLVAFKTHLRGSQTEPGACEIYSYRGGYGGCNQIEDGKHNLCFIASAADTKRLGSDPERVMREVVLTNQRAAAVLGKATVAMPWHAVPIEHFGRKKLAPANGLITIGDAASFIDPFTGSGILMAMESAQIAAGAIQKFLRGNGTGRQIELDYEARCSAAFDSRLRLSSMLRVCVYTPFFAEALVAAVSLSSGVRRHMARATRS